MARIFKTPFSAQGDIEQVPEAPQGDGSVSFTNGFGYDYEREYDDPAAKDVRREIMNGLFYDVTEAIGDIQLSGIAKWSAAAAPYPAGAVVWHDSSAWVSANGNNSAAPTEGENWSAVMPQKTVTDALATKADKTTQIVAGAGLTGGGNLSDNRSLSVDYGTTAGTAAQGNDSRLSDAREWTADTVSQSEAEAGTATTRRAWTAQRVFQAFRSAAANATETIRGTLRLATPAEAEGLSEDNAAITPSTLGSAMNAHVLGMGQTWQDVTASRALETTYTNTTGRTISVSALINCGSRNVRVGVIVDGIPVMLQEVQGTAISGAVTTKALGVTAIVPNGSSYRYEVTQLASGGTGTLHLEHSAELR